MVALVACTPRFETERLAESGGAGAAAFAGSVATAGTSFESAASAGAFTRPASGGTGTNDGGRTSVGGAGGMPNHADGGAAHDGGRASVGGAAGAESHAAAGESNAGAGRSSGGSASDAGGNGGSGGIAPNGGTMALGGGGQGGKPSTTAGGRGGQAGFAGGTVGVSPCSPPLDVDDMEDGDALICPNQGRSGDWWTATGTVTGLIDPPTDEDFPAFALGSDARPGSHYGMRFSGSSFGHTEADWASIGFYMASEAAYDLTPYSGFAFYAKSRTTTTQLHVEFATATTTATSDGGSCATNCNDHYEAIVTLGTDWQEFTVDFDALAQEGWG
jgi:hypothetical protein